MWNLYVNCCFIKLVIRNRWIRGADFPMCDRKDPSHDQGKSRPQSWGDRTGRGESGEVPGSFWWTGVELTDFKDSNNSSSNDTTSRNSKTFALNF